MGYSYNSSFSVSVHTTATLLEEKTLTFDQTNPLFLFGTHDEHLRRIEAAFPETTFFARGNEVRLRGPGQALISIQRTFDELIAIAGRNGGVTRRDIDTVLTMTATSDPPNDRPESFGNVVLYTDGGGIVRTKTPGQARLVASAALNDIVFAVGPAGTGKTYVAVALAVAALKARRVKRIILCRPAVEAGERLGFLPGDFRDKIDPYLRPLYDALEEFLPGDRLDSYVDNRAIEIVPLAYMRGRTLNSAYVILDEAQNATAVQMKMFLTRLGVNSRAIITGDVTQIDLANRHQSGLVEVVDLLDDIDGIAFVHFSKVDVVRHRLVKAIIDAYDRKVT